MQTSSICLIFGQARELLILLTQVAGRSGRGYLVEMKLSKHIYLNAKHSSCADTRLHSILPRRIEQRQHLKYPPFSHAASVLMRCRDEKILIENAHQLSEVFSRFQVQTFIDVQIRGPAPAPLSKIKNQYRWHFLILHESLYVTGGF